MTGNPSQAYLELDAQAVEALDAAREMPYGPDRVEALKKAGLIRKAADLERANREYVVGF